MRPRLLVLCLGFQGLAAVASGSAVAGPATDDTTATPPASTTNATTTPEPSATTAAPDKRVEYGVGIRLRNVRIPQAELELFTEKAGDGGVSNIGFGVDLTRRRGNTELQLGFEFEHMNASEGVYIEKNKNVAAGDEADFILSPDHSNSNLGWFTIEFSFFNHAPINDKVAIRYGAGAGLGIVTGELKHYNIVCQGATNDNTEPGCVPPVSPFNGTGTFSAEGGGAQVKYDLPPVFPVVNAIIGVQIRPMPKATINIEGGIRTFLFFGISGGYFF